MTDFSNRFPFSPKLMSLLIAFSFSCSAANAESIPGRDYTYYYFVKADQKKRQGIIDPDDTQTATQFRKCTGGVVIKIDDRKLLEYHAKGCDNNGRPDHFGIGKTLADLRQKGSVRCGVSAGAAGFGDNLSRANINTAICRGVAVAVYGSADKVKYIPISGKTRFTVLQSKEIDLLADLKLVRHQRYRDLGLVYAGVSFFNGPGIIARSDSGVNNFGDLSGKSVCAVLDSGSPAMVPRSASTLLKKSTKLVGMKTAKQAFSAYENKRCDAMIAPNSIVNGLWKNAEQPKIHRVLPDVLRRTPIGAVARADDPSWAGLLESVVSLIVWADEASVTSKNIQSLMKKNDPRVNSVLQTSRALSKQFGFSQNWGARVIEQVGNYSEIAIGVDRARYDKSHFWAATKGPIDASFFYTAPIQGGLLR